MSYRTTWAHLASLVEVNEAASDVIGVAVGDESEIFEEDSDVRNGWDGSDAELVSVVLVVGLRRGRRNEATPTRESHAHL